MCRHGCCRRWSSCSGWQLREIIVSVGEDQCPGHRRLGAGTADRRGPPDLLEIFDDRLVLRSTIITSQLPVKHWHDSIGDPTLADAILDRLLHPAHSLDLDGESLRKNGKPE